MSVSAAIRQLHLLASGGMAELYLAENGQSQRVVVKRIRPPYDRDPTYRALFQDEGKICGALDSPHIVRLIDRGDDDCGPFLVFEYIEGTDLGHVMDAHFAASSPLELAQACAVLQPLLRALVAAHETRDGEGNDLGLVHRDISPGNVLLSEQGDVYLADFGVAFSHTKSEHTVVGELKGKFAYMSPEQTQAITVDARSDLFAIGTLSWEMLTGVQLFDGPTDVDVAQAVRNFVPPSLHEKNPLVPPELSAWVDKLLAKAPEARYASARKALRALDDVLEAQCLETGLRRHAQQLARAHPRPALVNEVCEEDQRRRTQRVFRAEHVPEKLGPRTPMRKLGGAAIAGLSLFALLSAMREPVHEPASVSAAPSTMQKGPGTNTSPPGKTDVSAENANADKRASVGLPPKSTAPAVKSEMRSSPQKREPSDPPKMKSKAALVGAQKVTAESAKRRAPNAKRESPRRLPKLAASPKREPNAKNEGFGMLFLESEPWAYVSIDGAPLGSHTPLLGLRLPAGSHRLDLKNPVLGLQKTMDVTIRAGEESRHFLDLTSR